MPLISHSHSERLAARDAKRRRLLAWLRTEIWTTYEVAASVMQLQNGHAARRTLASLSKEGVIALDAIETPRGPRQIVGITMDGQSAAAGMEKTLIARAYERGRIGITVFDHTLDLQHLRLECLRAGWKNWTRPDAEKWGKNHRPDALAITPSGVQVAIECERTLKTAKRYKAILANHLTSLKKGAFRRVVYTSPTPEKLRNVERLLRSLPPLIVNGEKVLPGPAIDAHFDFVLYESLPTLT